MLKTNLVLTLSFFVLSFTIGFAQDGRLTLKEREEFQQKCKQLAQTFCGYIEELTEENSNTKDMTITEFFESDVCQFTIGQMRKFFAEEKLATNKIIGYTPTGKPPVKYTSIESYIQILLNQRKRYRTIRYDFSAFVVTELIEKTDENGKIYYEGEVKFKQNFLASKESDLDPEIDDWPVFHEDYKKLTFKIQRTKTRDGKFYAITFHKLLVDVEAY